MTYGCQPLESKVFKIGLLPRNTWKRSSSLFLFLEMYLIRCMLNFPSSLHLRPEMHILDTCFNVINVTKCSLRQSVNDIFFFYYFIGVTVLTS